jgi:osmotically-inducible protein OsmY
MNGLPQQRSAQDFTPMDAEDRELAARVRLYLGTTRPALASLGVDAACGCVYLRGQVGTFHLRQLAIAAARRVAGVRDVVDELTVSADRSAPSPLPASS